MDLIVVKVNYFMLTCYLYKEVNLKLLSFIAKKASQHNPFYLEKITFLSKIKSKVIC